MGYFNELSGTLIALNGMGTVEVTSMEADNSSISKIDDVVSRKRVTAENQELFFSKIYVKKDHVELFCRGQDGWTDYGNGFALEATPSTPIRFKANLNKGIMRANMVYAQEIKLGSIAFDLSNATSEENGEDVLFENVRATLYPVGVYGMEIR